MVHLKRQAVTKLALGWWVQREMGTEEVPPGDGVVSWVCVGVAIAAASSSERSGRLKNPLEMKQVPRSVLGAQRFAAGPAAVV